jgi:methanogenic corrinoid protein MtbC1
LPPIPATAPTAIGGAPEGDPYQLPTALVELSLREVGWNATSLGSHLPINSFLRAIDDQAPQLVWLSVSAIGDEATFIAEQRRVAEALSDNVPLLVGGRALTDEIRPKLRYTAYCDSLRNLVELASMMRLNMFL